LPTNRAESPGIGTNPGDEYPGYRGNRTIAVTSVQRDNWPINSQEDRAYVLASLRAVDYVVIFDEKEPRDLIAKILPQVLVKGKDWAHDVSGCDAVEAIGGKVCGRRWSRDDPPPVRSTGSFKCTERKRSSMRKVIIVTGAAGFIGRNVVAELNARGADDLLLVDDLGTDEKWKNLLGLRFENVISPAEVRTRISTGKLPAADAVIHLGACSATTERNADYLLHNNYGDTRMWCEWCLHQGARFIYASSAATYGDGARGYSDSDQITPTLRPLNMYGYSKHLFDLWALKHGLFDRIVGLKYFNVFGPFEDHKGDMKSVVQKSFHQIREGGTVSLFKSHRPDYADGEQKRDFIYVKDAVDVTLHFHEHRERSGLFNCGTGQARTWKDLVNAVYAAMKLQPKIKFIDMPETLREKYQYFTQADVSKLRAAGYVAPFRTLEHAVEDYVATHLALGERVHA